ncbi:hypothetical protein [Stenotrophomonas bentonitica]
MEFDSIRPAISGVIGGIIATWLTSRWARSLPSHYKGWSRTYLLRRHRPAIWTANVLFFIGLCCGIALYPVGGFANTDWRPLLLGFGLASVLPLLALAVVSLLSGRNVKEAYVAFALGQGSPLWVTYGILGAGAVSFFFALAILTG